MKKILIYFLLISCSPQLFSQHRIKPDELEALNKQLKQNPLLSENDADFKSNTNIEKWNTESAVILCQKTSFEFDRKGMSAGRRIGRNLWGIVFAPLTLGTSLIMANTTSETHMLIEETERRRLLLNDKYALEQYSILYFRLAAEGDAFAARVIKKDGSSQVVSLEDAIKVDDVRTVPSLFKSYTDLPFSSVYRPDYYKVAVPDLEEGDVIEYEFRNFNSRDYGYNPNYKEFDPVYYLCNRDMPVARQVIEVKTEDDKYYIGYKSLKGAPEFSQTNANGKKVYRWEDQGRDKMTDTRFVNEFMEMPSVKFQVIYARSNSKDFVWFKNEADMKKDISDEYLAEKAKTFWFNPEKLRSTGDYMSGINTDLETIKKEIYKSLKKKGITDGTDEEYVRKAYYMIRSKTMYNKWSDFAFAKVFSNLLAEKDIQHEVVVTTSNLRTDINKIAFTQELAWLIKFKNKYYYNPGEHLNPEEIPMHVAGNRAVIFSNSHNKEAVSKEVVPISDTNSNKLRTQVKAILDLNTLSMPVEKNVDAKGLVKDDMIEETLALTPYMEGDYRNYDGMSMWDGLPAKMEEKAAQDFNQLKKQWKDEKTDMMKAMAESEYGNHVEKYNSFRLVQDGRSFKKKNLQYSESFVLTDMAARAGEDILISLPALVTQQTKIKKEEKKRTMPVDVRFPRTFTWNIILTIPAGYTVKGMSSLNKNVSNDCASFSSTARIENNTLIVDVSKMYKGQHFDSQQWPKMLEVLEAAYNFSQSKIVLIKQ